MRRRRPASLRGRRTGSGRAKETGIRAARTDADRHLAEALRTAAHISRSRAIPVDAGIYAAALKPDPDPAANGTRRRFGGLRAVCQPGDIDVISGIITHDPVIIGWFGLLPSAASGPPPPEDIRCAPVSGRIANDPNGSSAGGIRLDGVSVTTHANQHPIKLLAEPTGLDRVRELRQVGPHVSRRRMGRRIA